MFIRLSTTSSTDVNVNVDTLKTFAPNESGDGSVLQFNDGTSLAVNESTRSIRGYIKKAQFQGHTGGGDQSED